jgi:hypothetical protein
MHTRRRRRLPIAERQKLAVLRTFFAPNAKRRVPKDKQVALALLVEYAVGGQPKAVPTESGRCYICTFPASWVREAIPSLGLGRDNKIFLCGQHNHELESLLEAEAQRQSNHSGSNQERT